ncbi:YcaO-like family protein [Rossellomorea vietnamensis]|uniref:YcaO-like family protein n=1 Tax=Rossellomorea vietnamensis TaxID=218284 RepID=UPI00077C468C|nr:YcaO-like family protein [Rossellomorea vietnamensis]
MNLEKVKQEIVNPKIGLIQGLKEGLDIHLPVPMHLYTTYRKSLIDDKFNEVIKGDLDGLGYDFESREIAQIKAIGECLERYCASYSDEKMFIKGSYHTLKDEYKVVDPCSFTRPFPEQYLEVYGERYEITKDSEMYWVESVDELTGLNTLVPVTAVYFNLGPNHYSNHIRESISTGLAAGNSKTMAKEGAILECIERDAIMIMWLNKISAPVIDISSIEDDFLKDKVKSLEEIGFSTYFLDITTDIEVPTYFVVIKNNYEKVPFVQVGAKSHFDRFTALRGAFLEAAVGINLFTRPFKREFVDITDIKKINSIHDHIYYYGLGGGQEKLQFLFDGPQKTFTPETKVHNIEELKAILKEKNLNLYTVDVTTEDVEEQGIHVVRAVMPELAFLETWLPMLNCKRLTSVPLNLGYILPESFNKDPHPFP